MEKMSGTRKLMLVLTRGISESIVIGPDTTVVVLGVKGCQVRLGIAAPRAVPVHRQEIAEKIKREILAQKRNPG
jgi:carbon storage regulator